MKIKAKILEPVMKVLKSSMTEIPVLFNEDGLTFVGYNGQVFYGCMQILKDSFEDFDSTVHKFIFDVDNLTFAINSCKDIIEFEFDMNDNYLIIKNIKNDKVTKKIELRTQDSPDELKFIGDVPKTVALEIDNTEFKSILKDFSFAETIEFNSSKSTVISAKNNSMSIDKTYEVQGNGETTKISLRLLKFISDLDTKIKFEYGDDMPLQIYGNDEFKKTYFVIANRG